MSVPECKPENVVPLRRKGPLQNLIWPQRGSAMSALYSDYLRAADQVRALREAERNPTAQELLQSIERNFERLAELKRSAEGDQDQKQNYNRPFAHFKMFGGD